MKNIPIVERPDVLTPESKERYKQEVDSFLSFIPEFVDQINNKMKKYKACPYCGCSTSKDYCPKCFYKFEKKGNK